MRILDIGCGNHKHPGAIGVDSVPGTAADVLCDLSRRPWCFADSSFDRIICHDVLEHLPDLVMVMEEIHRVGKPGALVDIRTPHFASLGSWEDPTHLHHFASESFDYFCEQTSHTDHYIRCRFRLVSRRLIFSGSWWSRIGALLARWSRRHYEKQFAFIFRPATLHVVLQVLK